MEATKRVHIERAQNFFRQYRDPHGELRKLSANQFMEVWSHYDKDANGYIEGTELDGFLREFVSSANSSDVSPEVSTIRGRHVPASATQHVFISRLPLFVTHDEQQGDESSLCELPEVIRCDLQFQTLTDATLEELKACFMEAYDDNQDGKIDIREVSEKGGGWFWAM